MTDAPAALLEEALEAAATWEDLGYQDVPRLLRALVAVLQQQTDQETEGDHTRMGSTGSSDQHIDAGSNGLMPSTVSDAQTSNAERVRSALRRLKECANRQPCSVCDQALQVAFTAMSETHKKS